jgi:hypothetical protein
MKKRDADIRDLEDDPARDYIEQSDTKYIATFKLGEDRHIDSFCWTGRHNNAK